MAHGCHDEHVAHGGSGGHDHDHDHGPEDPDGDSLFPYIDLPKVQALNVTRPADAKLVFKSNKERMESDAHIISHEGDPEMLLFVPFTCAVHIKSFAIGGRPEGQAPSSVKFFVNKDHTMVDFGNVHDTIETQAFDLAEDATGEIWYPVRVAKFTSVRSLAIFFPDSVGGEETAVHFIGFKGTSTGHRRAVVKNVVYESRASLSDHKTPGEEEKASEGMGM